MTSYPEAGSQLNSNTVNHRIIDPILNPTSVPNQAHLPFNPSLDLGLDLGQVYFTPLLRFWNLEQQPTGGKILTVNVILVYRITEH